MIYFLTLLLLILGLVCLLKNNSNEERINKIFKYIERMETDLTHTKEHQSNMFVRFEKRIKKQEDNSDQVGNVFNNITADINRLKNPVNR